MRGKTNICRKHSKIMLPLLIVCSILGFAGCGKQLNHYDTEYRFVINYLKETYGGEYTIKECDFQQYDYGITGGMFMYDFLLEDTSGEQYIAKYQRFAPLNEETVESISFEAKE